jgi:hypothetical protein
MAFEPRTGEMPRNRHAAEEIVTKLRQVDVLSSRGKSIAEAIRSIAVTEVTGGLKGDQFKRLKELDTENSPLLRALCDLTLDKMILEEAARGSFEARASPCLRGYALIRSVFRCPISLT